jgi:N-acetylglucosamine-6-sulfatase
MKWKIVAGAASYHLKYKKTSSSNWTVVTIDGTSTTYTVTGLQPETSYNVKVAAVCANKDEGEYTLPITVKTVECSIPYNVQANAISATSAAISWSAICEQVSFAIKYRKLGTSGWETISNINTSSYVLTGLNPNTSYQIKVSAKCISKSPYSKAVTFTTKGATSSKGRNVLLIIVDDARFDTYLANGGPSFFLDSNISRIATEGANFKQSFAALSMCAPSRASIVTGLYPHIHGVTDNPPTSVSDTITNITFPEILHNNGYYTGLIGKYHISQNPQPGYDYWLETHNNDYTDTQYNLNGDIINIPGHSTDVIADSAIGFLNKVPPGKPFFLWFAYHAPHTPLIPRPQDDGLFDDNTMPFPNNFEPYSKNYPQFLYDCHGAGSAEELTEFYKGYFEMLNGVSETMGKVLDQLENMHLLDSTLVIFMSDNGYLLGEHHLLEKQLAYDESMRIPIFMRYPALIPAGTKVQNQLAMNIDIAPTILDFAGINNSFGMQGISLLKMLNHTAERKELLYEFYNKECVPDIRSVRSLDYKYIKYNCSELTEEFFNLNNDPEENINQINNPDYTSLVQQYRTKLSYLRNYYQDFTWDSLYQCSLSNPQRVSDEESNPEVFMDVFPNPASNSCTINFISSKIAATSLRIVDELGNTVYSKATEEEQSEFTQTFNTSELPSGLYVAIIQHGLETLRHMFIVSK